MSCFCGKLVFSDLSNMGDSKCFSKWVPEGLQLFSKETPTQLFSCEYYQIFKDTFFIEHLRRFLLIVERKTVINRRGLLKL